VLAINLVADGLADVLDPRLKLSGIVRPVLKPRAAPTFQKAEQAGAPLLAVENLSVEFPLDSGGVVQAVKGVSFTLAAGERLGIVGESGSGKSVTATTIMGLLDSAARVGSGSIRFKGRDLIGLSERALNRVRGRGMAMIFQDASTALNPVFRVGWQIEEAILLHQPVSRDEARHMALELLRMVNIAEPERVAQSYPFEISGGMQQRAMIAIAFSCRPDLLIADEPTTALDVTTQAQILRELDALIARLGTGVILISHDLGVIAEFTDHVLVMKDGEIVESGRTADVVAMPRHPYTRQLLAAVRKLEGESPDMETALVHAAG
jgi:ABC-type dipeptide/oligopeptide/nickel transport system ATPase component